MAKGESHYLTCQDDDCELVACVGRRDYERKIANLERAIEFAKECMKVLYADHPMSLKRDLKYIDKILKC